MKRIYYLILSLKLIVFVSSCGDDEDVSGPTPTAEFSTDKLIVETGDEITFTNNTVDGASYEWDFGDGETSTEENPVHTYTSTGDYTVTLTAIGSGGRENEVTQDITVGTRFVIGFVMNKLDLKNADGEDWDDDGTPPDIMLLYTSESSSGSSLLILENDISLDGLPIGVNISQDLQFELTNENWAFGLVDNDAPFDQYEDDNTELMFSAVINPIQAGQVDNTTGEGAFIVSDDEDRFEIAIIFNIRN
ncbi:MAG: PKD domain-containing protein [Cyclobacteriaceae bacterium]